MDKETRSKVLKSVDKSYYGDSKKGSPTMAVSIIAAFVVLMVLLLFMVKAFYLLNGG